MVNRRSRNNGGTRRGAAAVELAVVAAPLLAFILVAVTDFARVFYALETITSCARNGALEGSMNEQGANETMAAYNSRIQTAALNDAGGLQPALTTSNVVPTTGTDANGNPSLSVHVTYTFTTIVNYPGIPQTINLSRTVQMRIVQNTPN